MDVEDGINLGRGHIRPAEAEFVRRAAMSGGLTWHFARPPVQGLDFEVDVRGMRIGGEAPGGGPILSVGIKCHVRIRLPATSDRQFGSRAEKPARAPNGAEWYPRSGKPFQDAGRKTTPSNGSPVVQVRT
jgi:hypothetical protein